MRTDKHANKQFYDTQRPSERERFQTEPSKIHTAELLVPWITSHVRPNDRVIDIGGGSGTYASQIVRAAPVAVVGLDISESMIQQRSEDPLLPENVVGDMEDLPFEAETFDAAFFVACLHHVPDPLPALREAWRVLRPGGQLFAFEPCSIRARREGHLPVPGMPHEFRFSISWLVEQIRTAGFEIAEAHGRRVTLRAVELIVRSPSLRLYRAADSADRVLRLVPGFERLGKVGMVRATKVS